MIHAVSASPKSTLPVPLLPKQTERKSSFLNELFVTLVGRGRALLGTRGDNLDVDLVALGDILLSRRGEASGVAIAERLLGKYLAASEETRTSFHLALARRFGTDLEELKHAAQAFLSEATDENAQALHAAAEPKRQELFRRVNLAEGGTAMLVRMRAELMGHQRKYDELKVVDTDLFHLFHSWFNRGFLIVRPIDWTTPANILEKIIQYEAVHEIEGWEELRRRTEPSDRRCFAFFHPALVDDPLIFVEVALTRAIPSSISNLLAADRERVPVEEADTAVFYSISNCQVGLRGISFGNFLIKQVAEELQRELPKVTRFVTLSPVPGFSRWLDTERQSNDSGSPIVRHRETLKLLDDDAWFEDAGKIGLLRGPLLSAAARYFLRANGSDGRPLDPVARFHLGNGARLERLNMAGDLSPNGIKQSKGLMVNYLYDLSTVDRNHEVFSEKGEVIASSNIRRALESDAFDGRKT
jgi:malonyl-CoA decarboxylase